WVWARFPRKTKLMLTHADTGKSIISKEFPQDWDRSKEAYYPVNDEKNSELFKKYRKEANELKNKVAPFFTPWSGTSSAG
ncbi:hypothetical protein FDX20_00675, partial [Citrobacter sp. TBCS-11]